MSDGGYNPDFIERNGAWVLSMVGVLSACCSGLMVYMLKSRCTKIRLCGIECERDVLAMDVTDVEARPVRP